MRVSMIKSAFDEPPVNMKRDQISANSSFRIAATAGVATYVDGTLTILLTNEIDDLEACS